MRVVENAVRAEKTVCSSLLGVLFELFFQWRALEICFHLKKVKFLLDFVIFKLSIRKYVNLKKKLSKF